jgi:enamine deaminase RidA (YjgF/YER057c/UK114 family)
MSEHRSRETTSKGPIPDSRFPIPDGWPRGLGYSHAVVAGGHGIYIAGQIGWDPVSLKLAEGGLIAQTHQAHENVVAVLASAGARPADLVRLTWFVTDRDAYLGARQAIGEVYRDVIGRYFPAMSVIFVSALLEPGAMVEIEATAVIP